MNSVVIVMLGALALALFLDGIGCVISIRHFERRQRFFRMTVKAPANLDAAKYSLINRAFAGLCSMGAGSVVLYWIYQYVSSGFQL